MGATEVKGDPLILLKTNFIPPFMGLEILQNIFFIVDTSNSLIKI